MSFISLQCIAHCFPHAAHGSGWLAHAFLNIHDTVRCIELAPNDGCASLYDRATVVPDLTGADTAHIANPRSEPARSRAGTSHTQHAFMLVISEITKNTQRIAIDLKSLCVALTGQSRDGIEDARV